MKPADLVAAVRQHQGAAVLAHPFRWSPTVRQDIQESDLDAIEIYSNSIRNYMQQPTLDLQKKLNLPLVATSDGHHTEQLGLYAIDLHQPAKDDKGLARMIRQGQFSLDQSPADRGNKSEIATKLKEIPQLLDSGLVTRAPCARQA